MSRQQLRTYAIKCARTNTPPESLPEPTFKWSLITDLFGRRLEYSSPIRQAKEIIANRALFGEVLITMYDLNVSGFSCVESARGELFISALNEGYNGFY